MSDARDLMGGIMNLIIISFTGLIIILAGGMALDMIMTELQYAGVMDVGSEWDMMGNVHLMIDFCYALWYFIPVLGIITLYVYVIRRQRYDRYFDSQRGGAF